MPRVSGASTPRRRRVGGGLAATGRRGRAARRPPGGQDDGPLPARRPYGGAERARADRKICGPNPCRPLRRVTRSWVLSGGGGNLENLNLTAFSAVGDFGGG